jgi:DNA-binding NarL/FixJ family response regulator
LGSPTIIRVALVDDDALVRAGLRMMLGGAPDIEVVGEAADGGGVEKLVTAHTPDVVLMDIRMPTVDGLAATQTLRKLSRPPEVIVLTTFNTDENVLRALRAGAAGFLLKDTPPEQIIGAIRAVVVGDPVLSPAVVRQLITQVSEGREPTTRVTAARQRLALLSERELRVASLIAEGGSNAEIAAALYMSVPTVKTHVSRILAKLNFNNRVQIALLVHDASP